MPKLTRVGFLVITVAFALVSAAPPATAGTITVLVGDKDGYGIGCPDVGTCIWPGPGPSGSDFDGRSAAEKAATNGAQITDNYSALYPGFGPNSFTSADVLLPFSGTLSAATLTIAMGDFQSSTFGPLAASINGLSIPFSFNDGFQRTAIHMFTLDAAELAAANAAGQVDLHLNRNGSSDFVAFDWFELTGSSSASAVPEPTSLVLLGTGLAYLVSVRRRRTSRSS